jgi:hypothetical protein
LVVEALCESLVIDYFIRTTGKTHFYDELFQALPLPNVDGFEPSICGRVLRLNCLTTHYADLWSQCWNPTYVKEVFTSDDERLEPWSHLTSRLERAAPLRTDLSRRQARVELDALVALAMGISEEDLLLIYRVQFPVLQQYERENRYDQRGMIVPDDLLKARKKDPSCPVAPYIEPFTQHDRAVDMAEAYRHFARLREKLE